MKGWAWCACIAACVAAIGCGSHRGRDAADAGVRGPEGGVLSFDAAMLAHADAGRDAWVAGHDAWVGGHDAWVAGHDAGHVCSGSAWSCSTVGPTICTSQRGCTRSGTCGGVSEGCYAFYSSYTCISQDGCLWDSSASYCSGFARSCDLEPGSASCASQQGCTWMDTCTGFPTSCSLLLTQSECTAQLGCFWE